MTRTRTLFAGILIGSALLTPGTALACNPIEALFGACRLKVFRPAYIPRDFEPQIRPARRRPVEHVRRPRKEDAETAARTAGDNKPLEPSSEAPVGSLALFRKDSTLRSGDIGVTTDGFKVYRHGDFQAIAQKDSKLVALEKASMRGLPRDTSRLQSVADRRR